MDYVSHLSNAGRRVAGYMLGERILPALDETGAWQLTGILVETDARAFLVTMMKGMIVRLEQGTADIRSEGAQHFWNQLRSAQARLRQNGQIEGMSTDVQKTLQQVLPVVKTSEDVDWLFVALGVEEGAVRLPVLVRVSTLPASYALFRTLKFVEHDRPLLVRLTWFLMKRGDGLSFNLASLLKAYYGLDEVRGTFSLHLEPFQLARLDSSYAAFAQAMRL